MNYQSKGLQFSLLIHAAIFILITCTSISESRLSPPVVIDFSIIKELKEESVGDSEPSSLPDIKMGDISKEEKKMLVRADNSKKHRKTLKEIFREDNKESPPVQQKNEDVKEQSASPASDAAPPQPSDIASSLPGSSFSEYSPVAAPAPAGSGGMSSDSEGGTGETSAGYSKSGSGASGSGGGVSDNLAFGSAAGPKYRHKELPVYPHRARRLGMEGKVLLRLTINEKGTLVNVEVIEDSGYGLADAAIEAVRKSTFIPATMNGKPIKARALLPVKFTLRDEFRS
ncbi:MAG: energy transducer TonB [Proteobacteria bacterium]|nr:energy transducer TonB [Pseudomonadota bacterium]